MGHSSVRDFWKRGLGHEKIKMGKLGSGDLAQAVLCQASLLRGVAFHVVCKEEMGKVSQKLSYNGTRKLTKQCHAKDTGCLKCTKTEHTPALGLIILFSSWKRSRTLMNWNLNFFETLASVPDWTSPSLALGKPIKLAFPLSVPQGLRESLGLAWLPTETNYI